MATETNTNTNQKVVKQIEEGNDIREKIKTLEKQNMHLIGESTILRQNLVTLEKENYELKEKQNSNYIEGFRKNEDVKKELKILQIENKIKENQLKAFKRPRNIVIGDLKPSWIFNRISADIKFWLYPFEYSRLKILHDYFYDEFEKLLSDSNIVQEVCRYRSNFKLFYKFFMMFSDKKELFDEMFIMLFIDFFDAESEKNTNYLYKVLYKCNLSWILNFLDDKDFMNLLNNFLYKSTHTSACLLSYCKIARERPFLLNIFLTKSRFHQLLVHKHSHIDYLLDTIDDETLEKYIDNNTIEYMDRKYLIRVFKNDYFE